jgi:hypothetical protein
MKAGAQPAFSVTGQSHVPGCDDLGTAAISALVNIDHFSE